jgi:Rrf2 family transcriptional regulator, nitric oxide-sensitive transcriptional repressor
MSSPVAIPETVSLAVHALSRLAAAEGQTLRLPDLMVKPGSLDHLSKVMQRLVKAGFVHSRRGRNGGFRLAARSSDIRLMDLWIALEGAFESGTCPMSGRACGLPSCVFGTALEDAATVLRRYFSEHSLADLGPLFTPAGHAP